MITLLIVKLYLVASKQGMLYTNQLILIKQQLKGLNFLTNSFGIDLCLL
ncbi:Uncharacterised protein [Vibrio cholerae]|uniref:Uncharacterized protein n=1 Tax=Vibrio cholerae TaxID=666 RepID=A0A656AXL2_VIBCL|nr:Uncharacterised protein [Vibrio cholerae]CSD48613.1 Uncharacterised protein [Vibrio cholerae]